MQKNFILKLNEAFLIERWNDKYKLENFKEIDLHAHKAMIAFVLAKFEEDKGQKIDWPNLIEISIFELLKRVSLSNIKANVYEEIDSKYKNTLKDLNAWIFKSYLNLLDNQKFLKKFKNYLINSQKSKKKETLNQKILSAAHNYASYFEFQYIKKNNQQAHDIDEIEYRLFKRISKNFDLVGVKKIVAKTKIAKFINLCGSLRFQIRWGRTPRIQKTTVLGHSLMVALLTYFLMIDRFKKPKQIYNYFYSALFHDIPEAITQDIVSPVKYSAKSMLTAIERIEQDLADKEIFPLIKKEWLEEFKKFIFYKKNKAINPKIVKLADDLSVFIEVYTTLKLGLKPYHMTHVIPEIKEKYKNFNLKKIDTKSIFDQFEVPSWSVY
jgi:putative hydrolase of HD superfamily